MPLSADDFVQENTGQPFTTGTSINITLPAGTTAGNTVLVFVTGAGSSVIAPTGFVLEASPGLTIFCFRKSEVSAGEGVSGSTPWTFTFSNASALNMGFSWYAVEMSNMATEAFDISVLANGGSLTSVANGGTLSTGTTAVNAGMSTVQFAVFASQATASAWSGYTNGFTEVADLPAGSGANPTGLAVARNFTDMATSTYSSTATLSTSGAAAAAYAFLIVYMAADSAVVAPLAYLAGFEWGTHGGMAQSGTTNLTGASLGASGTWGTQYLIQAGSARNGSYGLRIANSASSAQMSLAALTAATGSACYGMNVRVVSATGVVVLASMATCQLVYDPSTTKFGMRWGSGGTASWQPGTTALNTWVWVDLRVRTNTATFHADWRLETAANTYTAQTSPPDLTGQTPTTFGTTGTMTVGSSSQTMTADYDDVVVSRYHAAYPLGPHVVRVLTVDTAGTPSVSGTTTNFGVFTANSTTLAAWNATNARNAVDEVPPTISASADGVAQSAVAASDYMQFPMATYTCTSSEVIAGVRMLAPLWSGTGAGAGDLAIRGHDGTTETALATASQITPGAPTAVSSTAPAWRCAMWSSSSAWTQAELDAAALRVGFSGDATPDMGVEALYLEVATRATPIYRQVTAGEADEFTVDLRVHPYTSSSVSYLVGSAHAARGVTFNYSVSGVAQTPVVVSAASTQEVVVNADAFGDISDLSLTPDPLP